MINEADSDGDGQIHVRCSLRPFILLHLMIYEVEIYSPVGTSVTFSV